MREDLNNWVFTQGSISFWTTDSKTREEIKLIIEEAFALACTHTEENLPHEVVGYSLQQFKTEFP